MTTQPSTPTGFDAGTAPRVFMLDNYDSFTYNLVHYLGELGAQVRVARNDEISVAEVLALAPSHIVISPGPCTPNEAGIALALIRTVAALPTPLPLLGVCLGHQAIGQAFGGRVIRARQLMHGKTSVIEHDGLGVFRDLPSPYVVNRYHSLVVDRATLPSDLIISASVSDGDIMALRHRHLSIEGVQFHPESVLTEHGHALLNNFLRR